jgi:hypothetical protein
VPAGSYSHMLLCWLTSRAQTWHRSIQHRRLQDSNQVGQAGHLNNSHAAVHLDSLRVQPKGVTVSAAVKVPCTTHCWSCLKHHHTVAFLQQLLRHCKTCRASSDNSLQYMP